MIILPAIDLMGGKCVRLIKGEKQNVIYYPEDPIDLASKYVSAGAKTIHVVDLDGAFNGEMKNFEIIAQLAKKFRIQVGGGIRSEAQVDKLLDLGVEKVIVSTLLVKSPATESIKAKYYGKLIGSFDFKQGKLSYAGWVKQSELDFEKVAAGLEEVIVTDTQKDGTFEGPNLELLRRIKRTLGQSAKVIAAGGVASIKDLIDLKNAGIDGVIIGRALLEEKMPLEKVFKLQEAD